MTSDKPTISWTRLLGTPLGDVANALTTGSDGAVYVAGYTDGNLRGQVNSGAQDAFITRFTPDGQETWTRLIGTSSNDQATALTKVIDGGVYLAANSVTEAFIFKYDNEGDRKWVVNISAQNAAQAAAMTTGLDGSIYLTRYEKGPYREMSRPPEINPPFPKPLPIPNPVTGELELLPAPVELYVTRDRPAAGTAIKKYSPEGSLTWSIFFSSPPFKANTPSSLAIGNNESIYTAVNFDSREGILILRSTPNGIPSLSTNRFIYFSQDFIYATALTLGFDGSIYVAGYTRGSLDSEVYSGRDDAFVIKFSAEGKRVWTRLLGTTQDDQALALTTGVDGAIYVAGSTSGNLDGQTKSGLDAAFLTKYDPDGTKMWTRLMGTSYTTKATALTTGKDGAIYLAGYLGSSSDSTTYDAFVTKWDVDVQEIVLQSLSEAVNEGSAAMFNLTVTNVALGTAVAYTISGISASDVTGGKLTGSVTVGSDGKAMISVPIAADQTTEGDETLTVTVQGKSASTVVKDTSIGTLTTTRGGLTVLIDKDVLGPAPTLLKGVVEEIVSNAITKLSHTVTYNGVRFNYADIDLLIMTVLRDGNFTDEFRQEIADLVPSLKDISYEEVIKFVGIGNIDNVIVSVAGADGNFVG